MRGYPEQPISRPARFSFVYRYQDGRWLIVDHIRDGGQWWGKPSTEKYLLTGKARCERCSKSIAAIGGYNGSPPKRRKVYYYGCSYRHSRGDTVCSNNRRARLEWLDNAVISAIQDQALRPEVIAFTVEEAARIIDRELKKNPNRPQELEAETRKLRRELNRFLRLIAEGKAPDSVLLEIQRREQRLKELEQERASMSEPPPEWSPAQIRTMCGDRLRRFDELLLGNVPVARRALDVLIPAPLARLS